MTRGQWALLCVNHCEPDTVHGSCLAVGGGPCGLICSVCPLSSHGSLHVAFKCLTCAHTILVGLVLSWKEDKGKTLTRSGSSYWGAAGSGPFGTHQRITLARVPQLLHSTCVFAEGPFEKGELRQWGRDPKSPYRPQKGRGPGSSRKRISRHETE